MSGSPSKSIICRDIQSQSFNNLVKINPRDSFKDNTSFKADNMRFTHSTVNNNYFSIKVEIFTIKFLTLTPTLFPP